jgi:hypothetical protein
MHYAWSFVGMPTTNFWKGTLGHQSKRPSRCNNSISTITGGQMLGYLIMVARNISQWSCVKENMVAIS